MAVAATGDDDDDAAADAGELNQLLINYKRWSVCDYLATLDVQDAHLH